MRELTPEQNKAITQLEQDVLLELFDIDFTKFGGDVYHFCNQTNELGQPIVWQGVTYLPYPISADGFELKNTGASNRPNITLSNLYGLVTAVVEDYQGGVGAVVTRRQVYAQHLDAANFAKGNPNADPNQQLVSRYVIERYSSLNSQSATFELAVPSETDGVMLPRRIIVANTCGWTYRGDGCGYTGHAVADEFDQPTDDPEKDKCSKCLQGCRARFGRKAVLPFGGFVGVDKL
ncbi:phage minor tail protein L [Psychrobacter raelei]|uniref:Phage minor tail protein L n=1 Tax=Psychrobacter raelei TaxID=2565531 RepID=A0AAT9PDC0_9GAMM|nr:phage minor tail protein L [Psychrobacter sp. PraFG1]UNK04712.1 phage minor tail protein L [Psychrobacter sp. PraFG1]